MIYAVVGTEPKARRKAHTTFLKDKRASFFVGKENTYELEPLIEAQSLFGEKSIVFVEQLGTDKEGRDFLKNYLSGMAESENVFIIDEPFVESSFAKTLEKHAEKFVDAREEKAKGGDPFTFVNAFAKRDKKNAWIEFIKLGEEEGEAILGALWWKLRTLWVGSKDGRRSAFSEEELAKISFRIISMSHDAHRGRVNLKEELEKLVLTL